MAAIIEGFTFTDPKIKEAATRFAAQYQSGKPRGSLGHGLGMEVHDVTVRRESFQPGELFTIEPAISIAGEDIAMRIEDVILITEKGFENLSSFVPIEIDGIEKLMKEPGVGDRRMSKGVTRRRRLSISRWVTSPGLRGRCASWSAISIDAARTRRSISSVAGAAIALAVGVIRGRQATTSSSAGSRSRSW